MAMAIERILDATEQNREWYKGSQELRDHMRELVRKRKFPADIDLESDTPEIALPYIHPQFTLNRDKPSLTIAGDNVDLSWKEFQMLNEFAHNPNRLITKDRFIEKIWGPEGEEAYVRLYIVYVRKKIDHGRNILSPIQTVRGYGYMLNDPSLKNPLIVAS